MEHQRESDFIEFLALTVKREKGKRLRRENACGNSWGRLYKKIDLKKKKGKKLEPIKDQTKKRQKEGNRRVSEPDGTGDSKSMMHGRKFPWEEKNCEWSQRKTKYQTLSISSERGSADDRAVGEWGLNAKRSIFRPREGSGLERNEEGG